MWLLDQSLVVVAINDIFIFKFLLVIVPTTISLSAMGYVLVQELGHKEDDLNTANDGEP